MNHYVVNNSFIEKLQRAINRGVTIKIRYGIGGTYLSEKDRERNERTESVARTLFARLHSDKLKLTKGNEHSKLFICDDDFYVITSFNPLSFDGDYSKENQRGEIGELSRDKSNLLSYRSFFLLIFNFLNCYTESLSGFFISLILKKLARGLFF